MQDTTNAIMKLIELLPEPFRAFMLAALVAFVRVMYDGKDPSLMHRVLESVLCGLIALSIAYMDEALGMSGNWTTFIGGAVGLFGADQVRAWGRKFAEKKMVE
jgi:lambda family phage holin